MPEDSTKSYKLQCYKNTSGNTSWIVNSTS